VHVYAISVMVPWFDSRAYNAVMCSLPRFYGNEGMQPDRVLTLYLAKPLYQLGQLLVMRASLSSIGKL
jgi:hypothetical protein